MKVAVSYCIAIIISLKAAGLRAISRSNFLWSMSDPLHKSRGAGASRTKYVSSEIK